MILAWVVLLLCCIYMWGVFGNRDGGAEKDGDYGLIGTRIYPASKGWV